MPFLPPSPPRALPRPQRLQILSEKRTTCLSKAPFASYRIAGIEQDGTSGVREHPDGHALHVPDGTVPGEGGEGLPRAGLEGVHHSAAVQRLHPLRQVFLPGALVHSVCSCDAAVVAVFEYEILK